MTSSFRIAALALALGLAIPAFPQGPGGPAPGRRAQFVAASRKGAPFLSSTTQSYRVVEGVRAMARGRDPAGIRLARMRLQDADLLEEKGPFLIFRRAPIPEAAAVGNVGVGAFSRDEAGERTRAVAVNSLTGELGVVTGVIVVRLRDPGDAAAVAARSGLRLDYVAEGIRCAFLVAPDDRDVVAAAAALARDARVELAYPEVLEHPPVPN